MAEQLCLPWVTIYGIWPGIWTHVMTTAFIPQIISYWVFKGDPHMAVIGVWMCVSKEECDRFSGHKGTHLDSSSHSKPPPPPKSLENLTGCSSGSVPLPDTHSPFHAVLSNVTQTPDSIKDPPPPHSPECTEPAKHHPAWDDWPDHTAWVESEKNLLGVCSHPGYCIPLRCRYGHAAQSQKGTKF